MKLTHRPRRRGIGRGAASLNGWLSGLRRMSRRSWGSITLSRSRCGTPKRPFGEDRAWRPTSADEVELAECYELWNIARSGDWMDKGLIFLENAYRILEENGRVGIVLSNSIASIDRWQKAREWLMDKMRIVAIFDLPANVFAETGVNTTIIVAYKPTDKELSKLKANGYKVFFKDISKVGYEIRTSKRVKQFIPQYKIDFTTFDVDIDKEGSPILDSVQSVACLFRVVRDPPVFKTTCSRSPRL